MGSDLYMNPPRMVRCPGSHLEPVSPMTHDANDGLVRAACSFCGAPTTLSLRIGSHSPVIASHEIDEGTMSRIKRANQEKVQKTNFSRADPILTEFVNYCYNNPQERFWQALRNWSGRNYIVAHAQRTDTGEDTFYWKGKKG